MVKLDISSIVHVFTLTSKEEWATEQLAATEDSHNICTIHNQFAVTDRH